MIVESPAKARTVGRFLGKGYNVKASVGHIRDLLRSQLSVDIENNFEPKYRVPNEKREVVKDLKAAAAKAEEIYLATDPDREGEAIAWHLLEAADIDDERAKRVVFHEITEDAIGHAFAHPRGIDMELVDAQQARRILDRLVGYNISPLLWQKVRSRLSAGRVQSVALRLVVDREREIEAFIPEEYWTVEAEMLQPEKPPAFRVKLTHVDGDKPELPDEATVNALLEDMRQAGYRVSSVKRGTRRRRPAAPFTTSTMQQDASNRLGFTARRTMALAQQLYEGIELADGESVGLITYMRTDSPQVSDVAVNEARVYIKQHHGPAYLPETAPHYKTQTRKAQEAHEAVRPTSVFRTPTAMKPFLTRDQYRLYTLIWKRFVASQMKPAVYDTLTIEVEGKSATHNYTLRVTASALRFAGFLAVYDYAISSRNGDENEDDDDSILEQLPDLTEGDPLNLLDLFTEQHFTQPPARYSDATLVRALEEHGIGRPSTYAPIISTLRQRGYVVRESRRLVPTEIGMTVNDLLVEHFPNIVDTGFTAGMENELDDIADGEREWVDVIRSFYVPFSRQLEQAAENMPEVKAEPEKLDRLCPQCGHHLLIRHGRFGKFIGCSNFPECRHTEPWLEKLGITCPEDGGELVERKTRRGRTFYGCANYPECEFTSWKRPLPAPCPNCGGLLIVENRQTARCIQCEETVQQSDLPETEVETA